MEDTKILSRKKKLEQYMDIARFCVTKLNYSPEELNEKYDALQECMRLIKHYEETTSSFSTEMRNRITTLSIESDLLLLEFNELYVKSANIMHKVKRQLCGEKDRITQKEIDEFLEKLDWAHVGLEGLINETRKYIERVREFKKYQPMQII